MDIEEKERITDVKQGFRDGNRCHFRHHVMFEARHRIANRIISFVAHNESLFNVLKQLDYETHNRFSVVVKWYFRKSCFVFDANMGIPILTKFQPLELFLEDLSFTVKVF